MCRSTRSLIVLERRQDARRERRRTAALHELDQRVQIHRALARELLRKPGFEAGLAQPRATPGDYCGCFPARAGPLFALQVHASLAHPRELFLPPRANAWPSGVSGNRASGMGGNRRRTAPRRRAFPRRPLPDPVRSSRSRRWRTARRDHVLQACRRRDVGDSPHRSAAGRSWRRLGREPVGRSRSARSRPTTLTGSWLARRFQSAPAWSRSPCRSWR